MSPEPSPRPNDVIKQAVVAPDEGIVRPRPLEPPRKTSDTARQSASGIAADPRSTRNSATPGHPRQRDQREYDDVRRTRPSPNQDQVDGSRDRHRRPHRGKGSVRHTAVSREA